MPTRLVRLPLRHPFPLLIRALWMPILKQASPDIVALNIFNPKVVQVFEGARNLHIEGHLAGTRIVGLTSAEEREKCLTTISAKQLGCYSQSCIGRWWLDVYDFVSLSSESRDGALKRTSTCRGRVDDAFIESTSCPSYVRRARITICPHNSNLEPLLISDLFFFTYAPFKRMHTVIPFPRLHSNQTS